MYTNLLPGLSSTNDLSNIKTLQGDGHNKNCVLARTIKKMSVYLCADLLCIAFLMSFLCIKFCIIRMLRVHCSSKCDSVLSALEVYTWRVVLSQRQFGHSQITPGL